MALILIFIYRSAFFCLVRQTAAAYPTEEKIWWNKEYGLQMHKNAAKRKGIVPSLPL